MRSIEKTVVCALAIAIAGLIAGPVAAQGRPGGGGGGGGPGGPGGAPLKAPSAARAIPAETTAAAVKDPKWKAPRTSWGHPSLEGTWSVDDMRGVPLGRPPNFGTRDTLTPEEFNQRASRDETGADNAANRETFLRNEFGTRTFGYSSLVVDPPDGRIPEMTAAGKARAGLRDQGTFAAGNIYNDFSAFTLYDRCITRGVLGSQLPVIYGNGLRIMQNPNSVAISYEMIHDTRVIPLDGRPHISSDVHQYMGNARGRWDGDTLVVETTNFTGETSIGTNGNGTRHSDQLKLTERFRRVDPQMIEYIAKVEDPVTYTAPFTIRLMITQTAGYETWEYSCHEGNGAVGHALSGERAFDKEVAEAIAAGKEPPKRAASMNIYGRPAEGAEVFNINAGE